MDGIDPALIRYLKGPAPHKLEIGAELNGKPGWITTDLIAGTTPEGVAIISLDATRDFPLPSNSFDFVYSEHMIEHITFEHGRTMLEECNRILKPGGVLRIVTPSLGFLLRVTSSDRGALEQRYREWSVRTFVPEAPEVTNAFFLNNFVRAWQHTFIYDRETLELAMRLAGFRQVTMCDLNASDHPSLRGLENVSRLPSGFLELESMALEATKATDAAVAPNPKAQNLSLGKRATQSSVSPWSCEDTPEKDATRVVSGKFTGRYNCHTALEDQPWWRVDLERTCHIEQIRIYNRTADRPIMRRASQFEIQTSDDDNIWTTVFRKETESVIRGTKLSPFIWISEKETLARFVRLQLLGRQFLHLDQVEIFGEEAAAATGR